MTQKINPGKATKSWEKTYEEVTDNGLPYTAHQALSSPMAKPAMPDPSGVVKDAVQPAALTYPSTNVSKVYQHWADGDAARGTTPEWNNNILSDGKSDYFEGEVVPHVYFYKASNNAPLINGQTYSFNVTYNYYQGNTNAGGFVYMTTPNTDRSPGSFAGGVAQPDSTFTNGGGMQGSFNTVYANITAVSDVSYNGNSSNSIDGKVTITFVYTGPNTTSGGAEIQYGLMIAAPGDVPDQGKGMTDGANAWTGGSLQTTVDIGGSGATSIQLAPSAIIVGEISGMKFSDVDGNGVRDADGADNMMGTADDEVGLANWKIFIDQDKDGVWDANEQFALTGADGKYALSVVPDADRTDPDNDPYIVREVQQAGWIQTTANPAPILISALDPKEMNVDFGNMLLKPSLNIIKDASVDGGTADAAGEVITYSIAVQNTGNQTLTGITVTDPFISNLTLVANAASADGELDVGETWQYTASHIVLQSEIDSGLPITNIATADSDQTGLDTDDASVPVAQMPGLNIIKDATVEGGSANYAGEVVSYNIAVQNTGNQTLTGVTVTDPFISNLQLVANAASADGELDVGETWQYTASHIVLQSEVDLGLPIYNIATADSNQTEPDTDDASVPVAQMPSLNIIKEASVPGGTADFAGEVVSYTIAVQNTGNQTLTDVTVTDPFVSNLVLVADAASADGELDVGETWQYTASHIVTQSEIDSGANITNVATADSDQSEPDTDDAFVPVLQQPSLNIIKEASVPGGTADFAGEVVSYTIAVQNTGNQTLTGVTVTDPFISNLTLVLDPASSDGELDVGETWQYTASHVVTQSEIDSGANITNIATADSDQSEPDTDDAFVPVLQQPSLNIIKEASVPGGTADYAGEVVSYTIAVQNTGNQTLTGVTVTDPFISNLQLVADAASADGELDVGETWQYTASHVVIQSEIDSGANITNIATADSDQSEPDNDDAFVPVEQKPAIAIDKAIMGVSGGNGNGSLDGLNDVINYAVTVTNTGNQTLEQVTVVDPLTQLNIGNVTLAPGVSATYLTSYTLTQDDLDSYGGGNGFIENTATADSLQTGPVSDTEEIEIFVRAALSIDKKLESINEGNGNSVADAAEDHLNYSVTVANLGVLTLTNVTVVDPSSGLNESGITLAPGASQVFNTTYVLTQADLDDNGKGDGYIDNTATADSDQTVALSDSESTALLRTVGLGLEKNVTGIVGGIGNLLADSAGDVIQYSLRVYNAGSVTLTGVTLTDELTGLVQNVGDLTPGASTTYNTSYTLKQSDLDDNGGGNGYLENTSVADSDQTVAVTDTETVQLLAKPILFVNKSFVNVTDGNGNNLVDAVGDQLNYQILVANPGNVTLTDVSVTEALTGLTETGLTLLPNEVKVFTTQYTLQQSDLDNNGLGDGYIDNVVTADSLQTMATSDTESVPLLRSIGMSFDKEFTGITGGNDNALADQAGDVLNYSFTVTNLGSVTLTNLQVTDDLSGLNETLATLAPGASTVYTSSYTLQQSDLDSDGGGNRQIENYATADTNETEALLDFEGVTVIYDAQIDLTKYVSVDDGVTWLDSNASTGPTLAAASSINPLFKYTALNNGTVSLNDTTLTDPGFDLNGAESGTSWSWGTLAPGALVEYIFEAPFALGQYSGDAQVTATTAYAPVLDIDNAYYLGV